MSCVESKFRSVEVRLNKLLGHIRRNHQRRSRGKSGPAWHRSMAEQVVAVRVQVVALQKEIQKSTE